MGSVANSACQTSGPGVSTFNDSTVARLDLENQRRSPSATDRAQEALGDAADEVAHVAALRDALAKEAYDDIAAPHEERLRGDGDSLIRASIASGFRMLAIAAVTLFVTVFVVGMIADVMPDDGAFANESEDIEGMTGDAFVLGGVALIIVVASIILSLVGGFGGGRGGGRV